MKLMPAWKSSLELLSPAQLKPFLLVTGKTVVDIYKGMNKPLTSRGNWILAGVIVGLIFVSHLIKAWDLILLKGLLLNGIRYALFFIFALAVRPSVGLKDHDYFTTYLYRFRYMFAATVFLGITSILGFPFVLQWYMYMLFFYFDSSGSFDALLKAKGQSAKMLLYNAPLCLMVEMAIRLVFLIMYGLVGSALGGWGGLTLAVIIYLIGVPVEVALLCNIYIKRFHDQADVYTGQR